MDCYGCSHMSDETSSGMFVGGPGCGTILTERFLVHNAGLIPADVAGM